MHKKKKSDGTYWKLCDEDVDDATNDSGEIKHVPRIMKVVLKDKTMSKMSSHD